MAPLDSPVPSTAHVGAHHGGRLSRLCGGSLGRPRLAAPTLCLAVLLSPLLFFATDGLAPRSAEGQTPYQTYRSQIGEESRGAGGVRFEMARAGGLLLGQKRGGSAALLAGGMSMFTLGVDGTMLWHNHNEQDHRAYQVRAMVGFTAVELYELASWRLEVGIAFGERLRGERSYTELALGTTVSLPLLYGSDGWPVLRAEAHFGFAPASKIVEAFRQESTLSVYPFLGTSMRSLGFQGGFFWGRDDDHPFHLVYFGLIYGAPLG